MPYDLALVGVGGVLPGGELSVEGLDVGYASVQALAGQGGQLDLGDVEPTAVLWGVVKLKLSCNGPRLLRRERLVQRGYPLRKSYGRLLPNPPS